MPHRHAYALVVVPLALAALMPSGALAASPAPAAVKAAAARSVSESRPVCPPASPRVRHRAPGAAPRTVALTFDDGPGLATAQVLSLLRRNHVRATFFMLGVQVERFPAAARAVVAAGHLVANHTYDHRTLRSTGRAVDAREIGQADELLRALGAGPVCHFRAPGGGTSPTLLGLAGDRHLNVWGWSASSGDAEQPLGRRPVRAWVSRIVRGSTIAADHPVVLLHDGRGDLRTGRQYRQASTVAALQRVISWYASRGYVFVGLDGRTEAEAAAGV